MFGVKERPFSASRRRKFFDRGGNDFVFEGKGFGDVGKG